MSTTAVEFLLENIEILIKQGHTFNPIFKYYFIEEAKEMEKQQQEKSYGEEEVKNILREIRSELDRDYPFDFDFIEWFEQFKKK